MKRAAMDQGVVIEEDCNWHAHKVVRLVPWQCSGAARCNMLDLLSERMRRLPLKESDRLKRGGMVNCCHEVHINNK